MKLFCFIAIKLFFSVECMMKKRFLLCVLHFLLSVPILNLYSIKMVMKKNFTIVIPNVINCAIMKCGGCEYRAKPGQTNQIYPNQT